MLVLPLPQRRTETPLESLPGPQLGQDSLDIYNNITLEGAGAESTVIVDEVASKSPKQSAAGAGDGQRHPRRQSSREIAPAGGALWRAKGMQQRPSGLRAKARRSLISVTLARDLPFRMTGFTFKGGNVRTQKTFTPRVKISGNSHSFRLDHCVFDHLGGLNLGVNGFVWGVIDHCRFNPGGLHVGHDKWDGGSYGNGSWADDASWGSEKFVFIEDNIFVSEDGRRGGIDSYEGARFVVRYNRFRNCILSMHGTEGQGRGAKQVECYNNTYINDKPAPAGLIRSGCLITHDNTWTNVAKGNVLQVYRQFHRSPHWGISNGQNPYDDNAPNGTTGYWETGKHTGPNGSTVLIDSSKHWAPNQWYEPGVTYIIRNITKEAADPNADNQSFVISNTADTIICSAKSFTNAPVTFNTGDTYQIWKLVHSLDQPGLGKGNLLTGLPGLPAKWPNQANEPCYSWNNTKEGEPLNLTSAEPSIKEGRDFFNGTAKPGYKP